MYMYLIVQHIHPLLSLWPAAPFYEGLLSPHVAVEEPIKLALCSVLQRLCDCQVQHRVEATVAFATGYVESLQKDQRERYDKTFAKKPKEFRTSPKKQVKALCWKLIVVTISIDHVCTFKKQHRN